MSSTLITNCSRGLLGASALLAAMLLTPMLSAPAQAATGDHPIRVSPAEINLGAAGPADHVSGSFWLINTSDEPVAVTSIKPACGCTTITFEPTTLAPREATEVHVTMETPKTAGTTTRKPIKIAFAGVPNLYAPVSSTAVDPKEARVRAHIADTPHTASMFAPGSRVWFGDMSGNGTVRAADGAGPWAGWDRAMNATTHPVAFETHQDRVVVTLKETNDYYRLLERSPATLRITYWFDAASGLVTKTLVEGIESTSSRPDLRPAFLEWARDHAPSDIKTVLDAQEHVIPSAANAQTMRRLLLAWRDDTDRRHVRLDHPVFLN